jgi:hypothetical protein
MATYTQRDYLGHPDQSSQMKLFLLFQDQRRERSSNKGRGVGRPATFAGERDGTRRAPAAAPLGGRDAHDGRVRREGRDAVRGGRELGVDIGTVDGHLDVRLAGRARDAAGAVGGGGAAAPLRKGVAPHVRRQCGVASGVRQVEAPHGTPARLQRVQVDRRVVVVDDGELDVQPIAGAVNGEVLAVADDLRGDGDQVVKGDVRKQELVAASAVARVVQLVHQEDELGVGGLTGQAGRQQGYVLGVYGATGRSQDRDEKRKEEGRLEEHHGKIEQFVS